MTGVIRIHNVYSDFLKGFKKFLFDTTYESINHFEFNVASKTRDFYYLMENESFEYPLCFIELLDLNTVDGTMPISHSNMREPYQTIIAENATTNEIISVEKRWINLNFEARIATEDWAQLMFIYDSIINKCPQNFMFYGFKYNSFFEIDQFVKNWDFMNDDLVNVFLMNEPTKEYFLKAFSMLQMEPIIKITNITKTSDKEGIRYYLVLSFEVQFEIPSLLILEKYMKVESLQLAVDIDLQQDYPILIDLEENNFIDQNMNKGIVLNQDNFILKDDLNPFVQISLLEDLDTDNYYYALWTIEDSSNALSKRNFITLKNGEFNRVLDNGIFSNLTINLDGDLEIYNEFNFNEYNFLMLLVFNK